MSAWLWIVIIVAIVLLIVLIILFAREKGKNKKQYNQLVNRFGLCVGCQLVVRCNNDRIPLSRILIVEVG